MDTQPTYDGFVAWLYPITGIPQTALPTDSLWLDYAYQVAIATVNLQLVCTPGPMYMLAVYYLAADRIVNWTPDLPGVLYPNDNPDGLGYFAYLRKQWNINGFVSGVINSSADEGTSQSLTVPTQLEMLTLSQLQNLKTPWGREYLGIAQSVGTLWGIS